MDLSDRKHRDGRLHGMMDQEGAWGRTWIFCVKISSHLQRRSAKRAGFHVRYSSATDILSQPCGCRLYLLATHGTGALPLMPTCISDFSRRWKRGRHL